MPRLNVRQGEEVYALRPFCRAFKLHNASRTGPLASNVWVEYIVEFK